MKKLENKQTSPPSQSPLEVIESDLLENPGNRPAAVIVLNALERKKVPLECWKPGLLLAVRWLRVRDRKKKTKTAVKKV